MSNVQNEPMYDWTANLRAIFLSQFSWLKHVIIGWPDQKFFQVDSNLPAIAIIDLHEKGTHAVSQFAPAGNTPIVAGQGKILTERMRLHTLVQLSLFTNLKTDRDELGWTLKQFMIVNQRLQLLDYTLATPAPVQTGEYLLSYFRGDHKELKGTANFYQRDLTFEFQARVFDATPGTQISGVNLAQTVERSAAPVLHPIGTSNITGETHTTDSNGNPVDTISAT